MHGQKNIKPRITVGHGRLNKIVYMCKTFTGTPLLGKCKLASKPDILFYSASYLLPACCVQSVQRTAGKSTTDLHG
jgi:hypothetical protein